MLSRREILKGTAVAAAAALAGDRSQLFARAAQPSTPVNFQVPAKACDTHVHVFGDPQRFPFAAQRAYTPEQASIAEMNALHRALHTERVVIVHPSVYGPDNSCTLDGMKQLGSIVRGIAVIDEKTPESVLDEMDRAGMRGIRVNLETTGQSDPAIARQRFQEAVDRVKRLSRWHIQVYTRLSVIEGIKDQVMAAPMPIVFDHFGGAQAALGVGQPGFDTLLNLVRTGKTYVSQFDQASGLRRRCAAGESPDRRESATHFVGQRLAASSLAPAGQNVHGGYAALAGRRWHDLQPAPALGSGRRVAQNNPGRQSR